MKPNELAVWTGAIKKTIRKKNALKIWISNSISSPAEKELNQKSFVWERSN